MNQRAHLATLLAPLGALIALGCASAPETRHDQVSLEDRADATLEQMVQDDPTLGAALARAPGYVVFPRIGEGGFIVAGATGVGVVYERGNPIGYAELGEVSVGAQAGGQSYSQLVIFENQDSLERLKLGNFDLTTDVTATAITSGSAASIRFEGGVAVFTEYESGLMAEASVGGQRITFRSTEDAA